MLEIYAKINGSFCRVMEAGARTYVVRRACAAANVRIESGIEDNSSKWTSGLGQ